DICPLATLVVVLPEEREEDTIATMELVDDLRGSEIFYVPLFFTSEEECLLSSARQADLRHLTEQHWEFFATCWRHNINIWGPDFNVKFGLYRRCCTRFTTGGSTGRKSGRR
ncbi:MAG: hypothetical protein QMD95_03395, partial [Candidatus Hodarchaeaceae archaeon]|nr:hypothetical protein [Candidatus Hodarchaeaceae archaeon]